MWQATQPHLKYNSNSGERTGDSIMIEWLEIEHLFDLSPTEAIVGFLTPLAIFAVFLVALQPLGAAAHNSRRQIR